MNRFDINNTRKIIGEQKIGVLRNDRVYKELNEVINGNLGNYKQNIMNVATECFLLGVMYGKREERKKHIAAKKK